MATVTPLDFSLGARITDIDLSQPMTDAEFAEVHRAWLDRQVLVFPGQTLSEEDQIGFTRRFGEPGGRNRHVPTA